MVLRQATSDSQAKAAWKLLGAEAGLSWVCHGYARLLGCLVIDAIIPTYIFPQTGLTLWGSYSFERAACLGRMILLLSPGLRAWAYPFLPALPVHCGRSGPHDSTLVSLVPVCCVCAP